MRRIFFLLFSLAGLGVLLGLGVWQMQRLAWKQQILDTIEARVHAEPMPLPANPDPGRDKYTPVRLTGQIAPGELHVLTSTRNLGPGYRVIAPYETEDGRRILIDRGYIRTGAKDSPRASGQATLVGNLHWPDETDGYTPTADRVANIWYARDVTEMALALDTLPIMVVMNTAPVNGSAIIPLPVDTASISNDHLQYAITWFSLACIWAVMTASFLWRSRAKSES